MYGGSDYFGGGRRDIAPRKLSSKQREEISYRRMEGENVRALAAEFNVSASYIYNTLPPRERP